MHNMINKSKAIQFLASQLQVLDNEIQKIEAINTLPFTSLTIYNASNK